MERCASLETNGHEFYESKVSNKTDPNTVTMNSNWPETTTNLLPGQAAYDRQDLCYRVFKMKLKEIMAELKSGRPFGPYVSHLGVIEF